MGVIEPGLRCKTCGNNYKECEGHFGHLELARPVLNVLFIEQITKTLQATCKDCYRVLYPQEKMQAAMDDLEDARRTMTNEKFTKYYSKFIIALKKVKT